MPSARGIQIVDASGNNDPIQITPSLEEAPARDAFSITPSDTALFDQPARSIWVGGTGNVNVRMLDGSTVLFAAVQVGTVLPVSCKGVLSSSTTATNLVGMV